MIGRFSGWAAVVVAGALTATGPAGLLAVQASAGQGEGGNDNPQISLWTDQDVYYRFGDDGELTIITMYFRNDGPELIHLPDTGPWWVYDSHGHEVFKPGAAGAIITMQPGAIWHGVWEVSRIESFYHDPGTMSEHEDASWKVLATLSLVPADSYDVVWYFYDHLWNMNTAGISFELREGAEGLTE